MKQKYFCLFPGAVYAIDVWAVSEKKAREIFRCGTPRLPRGTQIWMGV